MRKRKRRGRVTWAGWLMLGTLISTVAGVMNSKVTAIRTVTVEGGTSDEHKLIYETMQTLRGVPAIRVDRAKIEAKMLTLPWIESASFDRTPVSTARLRIVRRKMVARLAGSPDVGLSADGVICRYPGLPEALPLLTLPAAMSEPGQASFGVDGPSFGVTSRVPTRAIVWLFETAKELAPRENMRVDVDAGGGVCLNIAGGRVNLGDTMELERKMAVLKERMAKRPGELQSVEEINLTQPDQPTVVPKPTLVTPSSPRP